MFWECGVARGEDLGAKPVLLLSSCEILGTLSFSKAQFPHLYNGGANHLEVFAEG